MCRTVEGLIIPQPIVRFVLTLLLLLPLADLLQEACVAVEAVVGCDGRQAGDHIKEESVPFRGLQFAERPGGEQGFQSPDRKWGFKGVGYKVAPDLAEKGSYRVVTDNRGGYKSLQKLDRQKLDRRRGYIVAPGLARSGGLLGPNTQQGFQASPRPGGEVQPTDPSQHQQIPVSTKSPSAQKHPCQHQRIPVGKPQTLSATTHSSQHSPYAGGTPPGITAFMSACSAALSTAR